MRARQKMKQTIPFLMSLDGMNSRTPMDGTCKLPFRFTGKTNRITLTIDRSKLTPEDIKKLEEAQKEKAKRD